jgi:hypothetical protein
MLGVAAVCWAMWKCCNRVCFEKKIIKNPGEIVFAACAFIWYGAGLYSGGGSKVDQQWHA